VRANFILQVDFVSQYLEMYSCSWS